MRQQEPDAADKVPQGLSRLLAQQPRPVVAVLAISVIG